MFKKKKKEAKKLYNYKINIKYYDGHEEITYVYAHSQQIFADKASDIMNRSKTMIIEDVANGRIKIIRTEEIKEIRIIGQEEVSDALSPN